MTHTTSSWTEKGSTIAQCACASIACAHFGFLKFKYVSAVNANCINVFNFSKHFYETTTYFPTRSQAGR